MEYNVELPYVQIVESTQTIVALGGEDKTKKLTKTYPCVEVGNAPEDAKSAYNSFVILGTVFSALGYKINKNGDNFEMPQLVRDSTKMYVVKPPAHANLVQLRNDKEAGLYSYQAHEGYIGKDTFVIGVDTISKNGKKITFNLQFNVSVVRNVTSDPTLDTCVGMKFSGVSSSPIPFTWNSPNLVSFANLSSNSLGQTTRQGLAAQITLDTNAAGHDWFIDSTPDQNDEFLPRSNPDVWIAKSGSAADGKMDMLSVLLQEYAHALGIEHSADNKDFIAASLQSLERRLPRAEHLGLVSWYRLRRTDYGWTLDAGHTQWVWRLNLTASPRVAT